MNFMSETKVRRWLLVDHNAGFVTVLSASLQHFADVIIERHTSPRAALAAFVAAPESYELVIADFEMPEMDGVEFCRRVQSISPFQKIFLATGNGYFSEASAGHDGFSALLNKPLPMEAGYEASEASGLECGSAHEA
jgi:CheY-like chemotaxis protein